VTNRQRAKVVELLRCAADNLSPKSRGAWTDALKYLDVAFEIEMMATRAFAEVAKGRPALDCEMGRSWYLEAALRVEQGARP
jgi:hypothetical protein